MPTNFLFFESIRKQLLNQGYNSIVIVNKHEGPDHCFLSKKEFLPDILLETNYLMVPLTGSYAVDIIKQHFVDKFCIISTLPSLELLESSREIIDNDYLFQIKEERWLHIYKKGQLIDTIDMCEHKKDVLRKFNTFHRRRGSNEGLFFFAIWLCINAVYSKIITL